MPKQKRYWIIKGLALCFVSLPGTADEINPKIESLRKCTLIENNTARLACLDQAVSWLVLSRSYATVRSGASQNPEPARNNGTQSLEVRRSQLEREVRNLESQKRSLERSKRDSHDAGLGRNTHSTIDNLEATVVKIQDINFDRIRVTLNNGQVWDQTERGYLSKLKKGAVVIIEKALFGAQTIKVKGSKGALTFKRKK